MAIIGALPYTLQNGTVADATQVMADFNKILTDVNANAANAGVNTNITSLTALSTPLSVGQGGTGQSAVGTAGQLMTSTATSSAAWAFWQGLGDAAVAVTAASTCNALGASSVFVTINGNTGIANFGTGTNRVRILLFTGTPTLTASAAIITPTGGNVTVIAGTVMIIESDGSSNSRIVSSTPPVAFVGDSGSGGIPGGVPAPAAGDAAANKYLKASGAWAAVPNMVGDSGAGGVAGLVPAPAAGDAAAGKYLKADGTWATVTGYTPPSGSQWPVGSYGFMYNNSGSSVTNGSTTAGSGLKSPVGNSSGALTNTGGNQTGTWTNITGATVANVTSGTFVRTA